MLNSQYDAAWHNLSPTTLIIALGLLLNYKAKSNFPLIFCFFLSLGGLTSPSLYAQSSFFDNSSLSFTFGQGVLLPEYQFINYLSEDYTGSASLSFTKQTNGKNEWEQIYRYPSYGLQFSYSTLGNNEVFGREYALFPFFQIGLLEKGKLKLYHRMGLGLSYVTEKFDLEDNFYNVAVGSHLNFHFNVQVGGKIRIQQNSFVNAGVMFSHFSNANTAEPNLGLNYISYFLGYSFNLGKSSEKIVSELAEHKRKTFNEIVINVGGKHSRSLSSKYYFTSSLSFEKRKAYFRIVQLGIGADLFFDSSIEDQLGDSEGYRSYYQIQSGIHISQTFIYNRFGLTFQEGIYVGLPERIENYPIYTRAILKYNLTDQFSVRFNMKSHLHILDYPELGIGIQL